VNGAGKTTQLQIITGSIQPDDGEILKQRANMKIAYLTQEFEVEPTRTVRVSLGSKTHRAEDASSTAPSMLKNVIIKPFLCQCHPRQ